MRSSRHARLSLVALVSALAMPASTALAGGVLYVDDDAVEGGSGATWQQALRFAQDALTIAADPRSGVTEIRFGQGTYRPDCDITNPTGTGDREATFRLISGVTLLGGYLGLGAGRLDNPDARDIDRYPSVLSGDLAGDDGPRSFEGSLENTYQIITAVDVDSTAILDGFVVRGGRADGPGFGATPLSRDQGSAVNIYDAQPTIRNCTFEDNWAVNHGTINDHGSATVVNCVFRDNFSAGHGAGLYIHHESNTTAIGCQFINNQATTDGGGAYSRSMTRASLTGCLFSGNSAARGGGLYTGAMSMTSVRDCVFVGNMAGTGGGTYNDAGSPMIVDSMYCANQGQVGAGLTNTNSSATIMGCSFSANIAAFGDPKGGGGGGGSGGGGIWNEGGAPTISDCQFSGNLASFGGGIYNGGKALPVITDCQFFDNHTSEGAGVYNILSDAVIRRCTFTGNSATGGVFPVGAAISSYVCSPFIAECSFDDNTSELGGGAVYTEGMSPVLANCLFRGNSSLRGGALLNGFFATTSIVNCTFVDNASAEPGGAVAHFFSETQISNSIFWGNGPDGLAIDGSSIAMVSHSLVQGGWPGAGNIDADPMFVDSRGGDFRLASGSPCIDSGRNAEVPPGLTVDIAGELRFVDDPGAVDCPHRGGDCGSTPIVDMGAHERQPIVGDLDGDGHVDGLDLAMLLGQWGPCQDCPADLDGNHLVNGVDLAILLGNWG